jgi:hypothetical protein
MDRKNHEDHGTLRSVRKSKPPHIREALTGMALIEEANGYYIAVETTATATTLSVPWAETTTKTSNVKTHQSRMGAGHLSPHQNSRSHTARVPNPPRRIRQARKSRRKPRPLAPSEQRSRKVTPDSHHPEKGVEARTRAQTRSRGSTGQPGRPV